MNSQDFVRLDAASETIVDNYIQAEMASENMVGVSVGVIKDGEIVYLKGFGFEDDDCNVSASVNTMYRLASISKTFTAVSALQLWEDNLLDLTEDIRNDVPEYPVKPQGTITMEDLLSNESGIQHYAQVDNYDFLARDLYINDHLLDYDPVSAIDVFKDQPILFTPGTDYNYSTFGFNLAAAVVEKVGNEPFETQVKDRIVDVADMPFFQPAFGGKEVFYNEATGYIDVAGSPEIDKGGSANYIDVSWKMGGGGWMCTARDLTHFVKSFIGDELMDAATVDTMAANHDPANGSNYGYGISTGFRNGDTLLWHSGNQSWCATLIYFSPENHSGVAIMTNNRSSDVFPVTRLIYDEIPSLTVSGSAYVNPIPTSLTAPTLPSPSNGATDQNTSLNLNWSDIDYADKYICEIADNPGFTNSEIDTIRSDTFAKNNLAANTVYYWRIKAINEFIYSGISSAWSSTFSFTTGTSTLLTILPFVEDFENIHYLLYSTNDLVKSGVGYQWEFIEEDNVGRAKFGIWSITNNGGKGALTLDALPTNGTITNTNYAILTLDLAKYVGSTDMTLDFDYIQHGEENHSIDRVWIRGNNTETWLEIYNWYANKAANGIVKQVSNLDIDNLLTSNGQSLSATFQLRIGQRDNSYADNSTSLDGVTFDNIVIDGTYCLSNPTVTSPADSGAGSLRQVLEDMCSGHIATISPALNGIPLDLSGGEIVISKNVTVLGQGPSNSIISGMLANRLFNVSIGMDFNLEEITLKDGSEVINGGAIYNSGTLSLKNVILENNIEGGQTKAISGIGDVVIKPSIVTIKE